MQFEQIYQQYKDRVYNLALHYVQHAEQAAELTQDVFVKIYQRQHQFRGDAQLGTWIYRITIRQCLDFLKAQKRKKRLAWISSLFQPDDSLIEIPDSYHPGFAAEQKEALQRIFTRIDQLPDNQRTVLILVKLENKRLEEVAEIMALTVKATESLLQRAKTNLLKKLARREGT